MRRRKKRPNRSHAPEAEWVGAAGPAFALVAGTVVAVVAAVGIALLVLLGEPGATVLVPLAALAAPAVLWSARGWWAQRLLRAPGPIKVLPLEDATVAPPAPAPVLAMPPAGALDSGTSGTVLQVGLGPQAPPSFDGGVTGDPAPVVRLGMQLRQHLTELRLTAPTAIPGARVSSDFVDLLGVTKIDAKQPLATVGQLLRLVRPTHAYEVKATVMRREQAPRHGVATETVIVPRRVTVLKTHWAESWDEAIELAASAIGALIVPLSRHSTHGVWATWRKQPLDERLFRDHQQMQRLREEQRYDEAIGHCYAALRRDPFNDHLRFPLGLLQEELALYADALLSYSAILGVTAERQRRAKSRAQQRAQRRIALLADYRFTVLLGFGERLSAQWTAKAPATQTPVKRIEELAAVRKRLQPMLLEKFGDLKRGTDEDRELLGLKEQGHRDQLKELLGEDIEKDIEKQDASLSRRKREQQRKQQQMLRQARVRLLLQLFALHQVDLFLEAWGGQNLFAKYDVALGETAVEFLPTWADLRAKAARRDVRRALELPEAHPWPPMPWHVEESWRERDPKIIKRLKRSQFFIDHYNAACTHAIGLLDDPHEPAVSTDERLAAAVVEHLEQAARVSTSDEFAEQWDWITSEDPDLTGVRSSEAFRNFEVGRFPSARPAPVRPTNIVALEASRYSALLIRECAIRFEATWHAREKLEGPTDIHLARDWWDEELQAWDQIRALAYNHRHWQTRLDVIRHMQQFASRHETAPFVVAHPRYADAPLKAPPKDIDDAARSEEKWANRRMVALRAALGDAGSAPLAELKSWEKALRDLDGAGQSMDEESWRALCVNRAHAWERLTTAYRAPIASEKDLTDAQRRLTQAATRLSHLPVPQVRQEVQAPARRNGDDSAPPETRRRRRVPRIQVLLVRDA